MPSNVDLHLDDGDGVQNFVRVIARTTLHIINLLTDASVFVLVAFVEISLNYGNIQFVEVPLDVVPSHEDPALPFPVELAFGFWMFEQISSVRIRGLLDGFGSLSLERLPVRNRKREFDIGIISHDVLLKEKEDIMPLRGLMSPSGWVANVLLNAGGACLRDGK